MQGYPLYNVYEAEKNRNWLFIDWSMEPDRQLDFGIGSPGLAQMLFSSV